MNSIFKPLIDDGVVKVYIDDILVYTKTLEEYRKVVNAVLQILSENKLYLKPNKCEFEKTSIDFLGMTIGQGQVEMDVSKTDAIKDWKPPHNLHGVRSFLGFCNFYRDFIFDFSNKARALFDLTKKDTPFIWGPDQIAAFEALKDQIAE